MTKARLDAHQSFWVYSKGEQPESDVNSILQQDYLPTHIEPSLIENGFHGGVAVQSRQSAQENETLVVFMEENKLIKCVIGWVDLTADNLLAQLSKYQGRITGFHHDLSKEPEGFILSDQFRRGLRMLQDFDYTFDMTVSLEQLEHCATLADELPGQSFALNHLGCLDYSADQFPSWSAAIRKLAERPNVYCKLSGLAVTGESEAWDDDTLDVEPLIPYVDCLLENITPERMMFASDWPHSTLMATFDELCDITSACIDQLSLEEQDAIMGNTAARFYNITGLS